MIKELWSKIAYYWFIGMLIIVGLFSGKLFVNASTTTNWTNNQSRAVFDYQGSTSFGSWKSNTASFDSTYLTYPVKAIQYRMSYSSGLKAENSYTFTIAFKPTPDSIMATSILFWKNSTDTLEDFTCDNWKLGTSGTLNTFYYSTCSFSPHTDYSSSDYLYVGVNSTSSYLTYLTTYVSPFEERLGTNAVITNQTNMINNSINNSTNSIINNNNQNTQNIIDNQNANNQAQIDSQKVCSTSKYDKNGFNNFGYITPTGNIVSNNNWKYSDFIEVEELYILTATSGSSAGACFYDENKTLLSCKTLTQLSTGLVSLPSGTKYFRGSIYISENKPVYEVKVCKNGNQAISDTVSDDSVDDPSDKISQFEDMLPENGVITQLIGLPITLYTKVLNSINGTCSQFNLGTLYNTALIIPCIDISSYLGSTIWTTIDLIISGAFVLVIAKKMIKAFENFTSMKEGDVIND